VLYIIKPQGKYTLARDEIQGRLAALDDIHGFAVMICQACGNPQSSASSFRGTPTAAWIKKFDKSKLVDFWRRRSIARQVHNTLFYKMKLIY